MTDDQTDVTASRFETAPGGPAGSCRVTAHHGELLQGVFTVGGRLRRGLVTLPCPLFSTRATFVARQDTAVTVRPGWRAKARRAAELTLDALGLPAWGGVLDIISDIPVRRGLGSSTADVTAAIGAVLGATGGTLSTAEVARLAVRAETASDSLMYGPRAVVFAHREGSVLEDLGGSLPPLAVLGFGTGDRSGVDTLGLAPAWYRPWEIEAFRPLPALLRQAVRTGDVPLLGRVATVSALLNQRHLPVPGLADILRVATETGAAGVQVAHSGDIAGLLFAAADAFCVDEAEHRLLAMGIPGTWRFETGEVGA